jgi:cytochrome c-type biogenesis protein CcmH/NrfG
MSKRIPLLVAVTALTLWLGSFVINNLLAASLIAYGGDAASRAAAVARAPSNPHALAAQGKFLLYRADSPEPAAGIEWLERAAQLTPRDYRFRLELARAYETNGQAAQAEQAFKRAIELAPRYFEPHWALANYYLRSNASEPALDELRQALQLSGETVGQTDGWAALNAYDAVRQTLGMNLAALERIAPPDAIAQAYLVKYLAEHEALEPALAKWRALTPGASAREKGSLREMSFGLLSATQSAGRFSDARAVWQRWLAVEGPATEDLQANLIANPGFEREPVFARFPELADGFDWRMRPHAEVRARRDDAQAHTGAYSLRLTLATLMHSEFQQVAQLIALAPQKQYRLRCFVKTQNAPERAPYLEITDAQQPQLYALRLPLPAGTNDWRELSLMFTTPADTRGGRLTVRVPQLLEPRAGEIWLDDFSLEVIEAAQ